MCKIKVSYLRVELAVVGKKKHPLFTNLRQGPLPSSSGSVKSLYFVQLLALDMYDNHNIPYRSSKPGLKLNEL